ncbi:hypothetical protein VTO42DRAFT_5851 [Malbranchea cinnamomea]
MRTVLPGRPQAKLQALSTALWDGFRIVAYISGHAIAILNSPHKLLQTIYVDDAETLEAIAIDETSGKIAVCGTADVWIYQPYKLDGTPKWSLAHSFRSPTGDGDGGRDEASATTLSWGSPDELLVGGSHLALWNLEDTTRPVWKSSVANPVIFAQFSFDGELIASTGRYDPLVKVWRRLTFGTADVQFDNTYLSHPASVTGMHWRRPHHREQSMENVLYTICSDNKIRIWAAMERHTAATPLQLWGEIDMRAAIQPRHLSESDSSDRRYGFIIDNRDFSVATERAVQHAGSETEKNHALEHLIEVATKNPEICVVLDGKGHMSAWGLENVGCKTRSGPNIFNVTHIEGLNLSFDLGAQSHEDYAQVYCFAGGVSEASFTVLAHYFDGRIEWFDARLDVLFDTAHREKRLTSRAVWSGHWGAIKKIVRTPTGKVLASRTDDNKAVIWRQRTSSAGSALVRQSTLLSDQHIHRTCLIADGKYLVNLHHSGISLWDVRSSSAKQLAACDFQLSSKPLCVLLIPTANGSSADECVYVATIGSDSSGIAWEIELPGEKGHSRSKETGTTVRQFSTFHLGMKDNLAYILPVDPAGSQMKVSGFLDLFATDIALSYTHSGVVQTWTAKVDKDAAKVDWLQTSSVDTGIVNIALASAGSVRKTAIVNQDRSHLTIWDTNGAHLEFEEHFTYGDIIRDLDWTSTPDKQSILAVGFPHKVILLSQLRYDYLDSGPAWAKIREIRIQDFTPHPIGDSCWLGNGNLVLGAGSQLFVYDKRVETSSKVIAGLRMPSQKKLHVDLFDVVSRLNGPLPLFHPQFLSQCVLSGKINLVHLILTSLYRRLKFFTEGDDIDGFLDIPLEDIYMETDVIQQISWKEMHSSYADFSVDDETNVVNEEVAASLNEYLTRVVLPQLSSTEQFRLVDIVECVATVEKHRRSMDDNAARYLLFFRQHMLRRSQQLLHEEATISWRDIVWAYHSESHEILTDLVMRQFQGKMLWENARECGLFMWLTDVNAVRAQLEIIARNEYTKTDEKNPVDCSLFYLALRKKNVLQGLWRMASWNREQAATYRLLSNNFNEPRWRTAALKNAFALLGKRRFQYAAAFFLLADHLRDAVNVCLNQLDDIQLAVTIARAYEGDDGPVLKELLEDRILTEAASKGNRWMATWAFWMLNRRDMAVRTLITPIEALVQTAPASPATPGSETLHAMSYLSNDPALVVLYKQLREKTLQTLKGASKVPARDEWDFVLRNARLYDRMGCDLLALDLVRNWEFLRAPPQGPKKLPEQLNLALMDETPDPHKLLRRRSSLVVADMPVSPTKFQEEMRKMTHGKTGAPHSQGFQELDANAFLDSFGF